MTPITQQLIDNCLLFRGSKSRSRDKQQQEAFAATILTFRANLNRVLTPEIEADIKFLLSKTGENRQQIIDFLTAFIELIGELVQENEKTYGKQRNLGKLKARRVKATIKYLFEKKDIDLPNVPDYLEPFIINKAVDWMISVVVQLYNKNSGAWDDVGEAPKSRWVYPEIWWFRVIEFIAKLFTPLLFLIAKINPSRPPKLSPALTEKVDRLVDVWNQGEKKNHVKTGVDALIWIGHHQDELKAFMNILTDIINLAEGLKNASGPEKKSYAKNLFMAVLKDLGFIRSSGLFYSLVDFALDISIDVMVKQFRNLKLMPDQAAA